MDSILYYSVEQMVFWLKSAEQIDLKFPFDKVSKLRNSVLKGAVYLASLMA